MPELTYHNRFPNTQKPGHFVSTVAQITNKVGDAASDLAKDVLSGLGPPIPAAESEEQRRQHAEAMQRHSVEVEQWNGTGTYELTYHMLF